MKYQQIKLQRPESSPAERSIQQSISQNLHRNSQSQHEPLAFPLKFPIHRSNTQTNGKNFDLPIETRTNGEKLQFINRKLKQTVKNFENGCTSTQPHKNCRNLKKLTLWMGNTFYTGPRWAPDDPAG